MDLALNNLQRLICHKTKQNKQTLLANTVKQFSSPFLILIKDIEAYVLIILASCLLGDFVCIV